MSQADYEAMYLNSTPTITVGDVFEDDRFDDALFEVVYIDRRKVLLRSNQERGRLGGLEYRMEDVTTFEKQVESGRMKPTEETVEPPEKADWTEVHGIGTKADEALHEAGVNTKIDVRQHSDDELLDIDGIGQKNLSNLKGFVR